METIDNYVPVRVSTLRGDLKIPFNVFVRVAGKFILYCREGESFEGSRLDRLKTKKLLKMYIPEDKARSYDSYIRENIDRAYGGSQTRSIEIRSQIIHGALQAAAEDLIEDPQSQALYSVAVDGAKRFVKFFFSEPGALKAILEIKNTDFNIAHHSVVVAGLALAICEDMKLVEARPMQMESLSVGCMIHDLEHHYNHLDMTVSPDQYTNFEKNIFLKHAASGLTRIKDYAFYDPVIFDIVGSHEEKIDGSGPRQKKEKDLDPFCLVVATANTFDHCLTHENLNPRDALKKILIDKMGLLSLDTMRSLQNALKNRGII